MQEASHTPSPSKAKKHHHKETSAPTIQHHHTHEPTHEPTHNVHHTYTPSTSKQLRDVQPPLPPLNTTFNTPLNNSTVVIPSNQTNDDDAFLPPLPPQEAQFFERTSSSGGSVSSGFIGIFAFMPVVLLGAWFLQGRIRRRWNYRSIPNIDVDVDEEDMRRL
jgi:hypothetical protein